MRIENKTAYHKACIELEELLSKGFEAMSKQEDLQLAELSDAIEQWESTAYPMPVKPTFIELLDYLLRSNGIQKGELAKRLGISAPAVSALMKGREPNATILSNLHANFGLDGNLILESLLTKNESNI